MTSSIIEKLKQSPLFNLSLSSKELFHSNFLYWLGQNYPCEFGEMFAEYLKGKPESYCISKIEREKSNIDISFSYFGGYEVFIENKVKSVPYIEQLKRYSKSNTEKQSYILLSLSEPKFFLDKDTDIEGVWSYLSYSGLRERLSILSNKIENEYHRQIIVDYCNFIGALVDVNKLCDIRDDDKFNFHSIDEDLNYTELRSIRLHDFYLKKKYELLSYEVYKRLKDSGRNIINFSERLNWSNKEPVVFMGYGMTRGVALMDLKYLIAKKLVLGIQIQGEHYRMVVESKDSKKTAKRIKDELLDKKLWFEFNDVFSDESVYMRYPTRRENKFNKYGDDFFYKSVKLGKELEIKDIINIVVEDVMKIEKNRKEILMLL